MRAWTTAILLGFLLQGGAVAALSSRGRARAAALACVAELASPVLAFLVLPSLGLSLPGARVVQLGVLVSFAIELGFYVALLPAISAGRAALVCACGNVAGLWLSSALS
ncbi:MAG: hypothetical protein IT374_09200 [Polyangiaceae bacterium]|nr:hypothetical protein [Polyangiaceae bacterium]